MFTLCLLPGLLVASGSPQHSSSFGTSIAAMGDLNGDEIPDFAVGSPAHGDGDRNAAGAVWVIDGSRGTVLRELHGRARHDRFGQVVASGGDADADGFQDLLVVATGYPRGTGYARIHSGRTGTVLHTVEASDLGNIGSAVCWIGDVDSDDKDDFAVGSWTGNVEARKDSVTAFSGGDGSMIFSLVWDEPRYLRSVDGGRDVDGDGCPDLVVGLLHQRHSSRGQARVLSGKNGSEIIKTSGGDRLFGTSVAMLPDLDGDGRSEYVVGSEGTSDLPGTAAIYSSKGDVIHSVVAPPSPFRYAPSRFGELVHSAGDVDKDGKSDWMVSAPGANAFVGSVYIFSGESGQQLLEVSGKMDLLDADWRFGVALADLGDANGDGHDDVLMGCGSEKAQSAFYVRLVSGADGATLRELTLESVRR